MLAGPFLDRGTLFGKGATPVVERKLAFLEARHKVIANNIANVETRFYKNQDLPVEDFHRLLNKSIEARDNKHVKTFEFITNSNVYPEWHGGAHYNLMEKDGGILRHGDNDVDIDREVSKLAKNGLMYRTMSRLAKKSYDLMRSTIRETP